ncbi:hypothetical protein GCM10009789_63210 [Kribbella sancticallisti]|uniref:Uncharacterized protein n=1 Tax=Kribbella sancticallisti TaxID=460087 RepID=A0ABN2E960_9ACTN
MKSSGSIWFVYGIAVVVTFSIGVLSFSVFVLAKVFGSSPEATPTAPVVSATPTARTLPKARALRYSAARVLAVRAVDSNPRQLVLVVSTPTGCAQKLQAASIKEGPGAIAVRVTQQTYRTGCPWQREQILTTATTPIANRTLIVNGTLWTSTVTGGYELALSESRAPRNSTAGRTTSGGRTPR